MVIPPQDVAAVAWIGAPAVYVQLKSLEPFSLRNLLQIEMPVEAALARKHQVTPAGTRRRDRFFNLQDATWRYKELPEPIAEVGV